MQLAGALYWSGKVERHAERVMGQHYLCRNSPHARPVIRRNDAIAAAEQLIADLPDSRIWIPGQLVADAIIVSVDHAMPCPSRVGFEVELLLLEEG